MCGGGGSCGADEVQCTEEDFRVMNETIRKTGAWHADLRRLLYRNVACEHRKVSDIVRHMPDVPGWA